MKGSQSGSQCKKNMGRTYISMCHRLLMKITHHCEKYRNFTFMIHFFDKHWFNTVFDFQWLRKFTCLFWEFSYWLQEEITVKCNMGTSVWNDRNNKENKWFSLRRGSALKGHAATTPGKWVTCPFELLQAQILSNLLVGMADTLLHLHSKVRILFCWFI